MQLQSTLTCPKCGHQKQETMPENACVVSYECEACGSTLRPLGTDCCVFCSFGSVSCPPVQAQGKCCD
jgi:transposase-like protein